MAMQPRLIRLRFRRELRRSQRQVEDFGSQAESSIDQHLFKRLGRLGPIRRFMGAWLGLVCLLIVAVVMQNLLLSNYFQTLGFVPGGIYQEGVLGRFTNANPMFAVSDADQTVSRLIFAGLFKYGNSGELTGDLASSYSVDSRSTTYTVHLKPNLKWQDGQPLTSADVVFTYDTIKNPDTQSPLLGGWQGTQVSAPDKQTIVFKLNSPLAAFPYNLTNGIVPKHLLANTPAVDLRSADFNTVHPVGAGPFAWQAVQVTGSDPERAEEQVGLEPFAGYQGGKPKLQRFVVHVFAEKRAMLKAFEGNQLTAIEGINDVDMKLQKRGGVQTHSMLLRAANMVFFKTSAGVLSDAAVRSALVQSVDTNQIIKQLGYATHAVREPLLNGQVGYDPSVTQYKFNTKAAEDALTTDGWQLNNQGVRVKNGKPLSFALTVSENNEYRSVARQLQRSWQQLGVKAELRFLSQADFQTSLKAHDYDAVLHGISIGVDPDVFVYWDSSQADIRSTNRLNLSEYKNTTADAALEAGRTRLDPKLRAVKYKPFLESWAKDNPALGLYQPRLLYLTNGAVSGLTSQPITSPVERFDNVQNWQIRQAKVTDN